MYYVSLVLSLLLLLMPCAIHADLSGTVTDTGGNPIEGALVTATNESDPDDSESVYTDESGFYKIIATTSGVNEESPLPFTLSQNYPNPFNPTTTIPFKFDITGHVTLTVYNIMGQHVRTLVDGYREAGTYTVTWDGLDSDGVSVGAGLYLYRLLCGTRTETRKMLLIDGGNSISAGAVPIMRPTGVEKSTVAGEGLYKITVSKDGYQPCFRHRVGIIADADMIIDFVACSSAVHDIHGIPFVSIPGGTFRMGSNYEDSSQNPYQGEGWMEHERPTHDVTLDRFEMGIYEITNTQYATYLNAAITSNEITVNTTDYKVTGATGTYSGELYFLYGKGIRYSNNVFTVESGKENYPTIRMTWYGAKAFALYYGFDLPSEAEWEYACRAGTETLFYTGNEMDSNGEESTSLDLAGWYYYNSYESYTYGDWPYIHEVGLKIPNAFGLFDTHGNVWEWCNDWYDSDYYSSSPSNNPTGSAAGSGRVYRGGGWNINAMDCRSAWRGELFPSHEYNSLGFRVVRRP